MTSSQACELYIDGASRGNPGPASVGGVLVRKDSTVLKRFSKYIGETTNNVAEYLALIYGLHEALDAGCQSLHIKTDSELLARQINGQYKVRDLQLRLFHDLAQRIMERFKACTIAHIPRELNKEADRLAGEAVRTHVRARTL